MSLKNIIGMTLFITSVTAVSNNIHRHMNKDDLRNTFYVDSHSEVPEYEVVKVRSATRSDNPDRHNLRLTAFGRNLDLKLKPNQGLLKNELKFWFADSNSTGHVRYKELPHDDIGYLYQDEDKQAAILIHQDTKDGSLLMEGTIGHDLVVKPVPAHIRQHLHKSKYQTHGNDDDEMFLDDEALEDEAVTDGFPLRPRHKHIVFKRSLTDTEQLGDYAFMEPDETPQKTRIKRSTSVIKREAPYVIYPEILVIVDYDGYRLHGGDNVQIKRYFVSFWNGVDLRYKLLKGPKIRISIAGIIISRGRDATPYLERNRVGRDAIDSAAALTDMGKYLFRERRLPVYDIAVAVTKLDMCRRQYPNEVCNRGTAGFAYVGGACVVNKRLEKVNSVAIIEDTGGFSGIIVAAHEVGHLLGAVHDGSPPPTYLGGPGAEKCRWEDGYIMSDLRHTEKGFRWSPCSIASFHHFLNGDTATCLYNSPHEDESLPRVLPGKLLTLDAQCRKDRGTSACFKDDRVCAQLFCFDAGSGYCVAYRPAAEGSSCGDGQICNNGRCIPEHENIIPDYSQNTPAYLRRNDDDSAATQTRPIYSYLNSTTQRSEWEEFWRTANATESTRYTPTPNAKSYYHYETTTKSYTNTYTYGSTLSPRETYSITTTTAKPYTSLVNNYIYQPYSTTKNPYNFANFGLNQYKQTTKNVYEANNKQFYSSTKSPHDNKPQKNITKYGSTKMTYDKKHTNYEYNRFYTSPLHNSKYSETTPQLHTTAKTYTTIKSVDDDTECVDQSTVLNGGISCYEFLIRYGYQYCGAAFFIQNCCAAQKYICDKRSA